MDKHTQIMITLQEAKDKIIHNTKLFNAQKKKKNTTAATGVGFASWRLLAAGLRRQMRLDEDSRIVFDSNQEEGLSVICEFTSLRENMLVGRVCRAVITGIQQALAQGSKQGKRGGMRERRGREEERGCDEGEEMKCDKEITKQECKGRNKIKSASDDLQTKPHNLIQ